MSKINAFADALINFWGVQFCYFVIHQSEFFLLSQKWIDQKILLPLKDSSTDLYDNDNIEWNKRWNDEEMEEAHYELNVTKLSLQ